MLIELFFNKIYVQVLIYSYNYFSINPTKLKRLHLKQNHDWQFRKKNNNEPSNKSPRSTKITNINWTTNQEATLSNKTHRRPNSPTSLTISQMSIVSISGQAFLYIFWKCLPICDDFLQDFSQSSRSNP